MKKLRKNWGGPAYISSFVVWK